MPVVNDVLAVGVAVAVVLVLAMILGAAELASRVFRAARRRLLADPRADATSL